MPSFYFGLSHSEGSRAAILNSLSVFSVVIFACIFFKSDRMTVKKIIGCMVGFAGILSLNLGGAESGKFTWLGDGMIDSQCSLWCISIIAYAWIRQTCRCICWYRLQLSNRWCIIDYPWTNDGW